MSCILGNFEGTWNVTLGSRTGHQLHLTRTGNQFELSDGSTVLHNDLVFDNVACTFKNETTCLSLWQGCDRLFAIEDNEDIDESYHLWSAEKLEGGSSEDPSLDIMKPCWRLDLPWSVKETDGNPPVRKGDTVKIVDLPAGDFKIFRNEDPQQSDTLVDNERNRTLDGALRTVALWDRGESTPNFIFAMVIAPEALMGKIRQAWPDIAKIEEILKGVRAYLPFEIKLLARNAVASSVRPQASTVGVWGAEEG